jgi:hypothetical protein
MLANTLEALRRTSTLTHAVLVTGLKHYLGPFKAYAAAPAETPFRESQDRLPFQNFYYEKEDILFAAAADQGFTWSVHRPHTMIGYAFGNVTNMGVTLAVYGSICRAAGEPFVFPGSPQQCGVGGREAANRRERRYHEGPRYLTEFLLDRMAKSDKAALPSRPLNWRRLNTSRVACWTKVLGVSLIDTSRSLQWMLIDQDERRCAGRRI